MSSASGGGREGFGRSGSRDWGELDVFFAGLQGKLSSSRVESVITSLKDEEVSVEDIAQMKTKTLYNFGVNCFEDAKLIVNTAKQHVKPRHDSAEATPEKQDVSLMVQQYSHKKLMDVPLSVLDVVCRQLDPGGEGLKTWEHFGETLLGLSIVEVREFRGYKSGPTKAIIERKIATDPDATLLDVVRTLEQIGRREVIKLLEEKVSSQPPPLTKQSSNHGAHPVQPPPLTKQSSNHGAPPHNRRIPHQGSSSLDSGYGDPAEERDPTAQFKPQPGAPGGPQHSVHPSPSNSVPPLGRFQSRDTAPLPEPQPVVPSGPQHSAHPSPSNLVPPLGRFQSRDVIPEPQPVVPGGPQHSAYQYFQTRSQSADSEPNNSHFAPLLSGTGRSSSNFASQSVSDSADSSYTVSFEHWESQLPQPQVASGYPTPPQPQVATGYPTPPQPQVATGYPTPPQPQVATGCPTPPQPQVATGIGYPTPPQPQVATGIGYTTPPQPQVATGIGYTTPPQPQVATGDGYITPQVEYDHFHSFQPQSMVMPALQQQQPSTKRVGTVSDIEQLRDTFRQMTLAGGQTISLVCNVINTTTNTPLPYSTATNNPPHTHSPAEATALRDITPIPKSHRLKQFSPSAVPIGTEIRVKITADTSCYLYILNIGSSGNVTMLLPNEYQRDNFLPVGRTYSLPAEDYSLEISGPAGREVIQVMAFSRRLDDLPAMAQPPSGQVLRNIELVRQKLDSYERWGFAQMEFLVVTN